MKPNRLHYNSGTIMVVHISTPPSERVRETVRTADVEVGLADLWGFGGSGPRKSTIFVQGIILSPIGSSV